MRVIFFTILLMKSLTGGAWHHSPRQSIGKFPAYFSYLNGQVVPRGTPGSVRLDVVEGPLTSVKPYLTRTAIVSKFILGENSVRISVRREFSLLLKIL
jgi:hypothetical protein